MLKLCFRVHQNRPYMNRIAIFLLFSLCILGTRPVCGETPSSIRIAVLTSGTLHWEVSVIQNEGLDKKYGIAVEPVPLASAETAKIALQGGGADVIVSDWLWAVSQYQQGIHMAFMPYSMNYGGLVVPIHSTIRDASDLRGKRLGIAGGGLDKNWHLLQAMAKKRYNVNLDHDTEKTFAAPPLLSEQFQQGKLDAVLTYWNYAAKLEAQGYRLLLDGQAMLKELGIEANIPALGYIFHQEWARANRTYLTQFFRAADEAKKRLCESDTVWAKVVPLTQEKDPIVQANLRKRYCTGRITQFGAAEKKAAAALFTMIQTLRVSSSEDTSLSFPNEVFWTP